MQCIFPLAKTNNFRATSNLNPLKIFHWAKTFHIKTRTHTLLETHNNSRINISNKKIININKNAEKYRGSVGK